MAQQPAGDMQQAQCNIPSSQEQSREGLPGGLLLAQGSEPGDNGVCGLHLFVVQSQMQFVTARGAWGQYLAPNHQPRPVVGVGGLRMLAESGELLRSEFNPPQLCFHEICL